MGERQQVVRSWKSCAFWFIFSTTPAFFLVLELESERSQRDLEYILVLSVLTLFGMQGFFAEMLGLRADEAGFSFPHRLFPRFSFPVLWRKRIPAKNVSRIDSLASRTVRLYLTSCELVDFIFPDEQKMKGFKTFAKKAYLEPNYIWRPTTKKSV